MSTQTLIPASLYINDHYQSRSQSNERRFTSKNKLDNTSPSQRKRYKFSNTNTEQYTDIYKFPTKRNEKRSRSSDTNRYYFSLENSIQNPQPTLTYLRSGSGLEQRTVTFVDGSSTFISDTPYLFSKSRKYPTTQSTYIHSDDTWPSQRTLDSVSRQSSRTDTVTSTNGSLSLIKRPPTDKTVTVRFESSLSTTVHSYLNETHERLSVKHSDQSIESFEKSVDRLVSSVNKKYGQQSQIISPSISSSLNYISQYYAKEDEQTNENDDQQQRLYYNLNTNRIHTQIMKSVNKSLIDHNYQIDKNRLKYFEQNVRRYLRLYENQSLQRELNYDLVRCFSTSYLHDLRHEEFRQNQIRSHMHSYTYEDIQDIHIPSKLEAYKMKISIDREKYQRLQSSFITGQLSPSSSSGYSPIMIGSLNENLDTQSGGFETDRKSFTSISQISPNIDIFYEIMQETFRGVDASIADHVSNASQFTKLKSHRTTRDVDTKSISSFWSDDEIRDQYIDRDNSRKRIPHQRKISRYISTVNRSLLDHPSDLILDFYLSQLNLNMQESVRNIELISRDKAYKREYIKLNRSLSAEHLYQVRKEHLRYKQPFTKPMSFTAEDVADIYKRFVLENYKRKIAIELERRRRQRQFISNSSETDLSRNIIKSFHQPRASSNFLMVSPPIIVQTKEIIMGRARQTITKDGSDDIVHHISTMSPPPIYAVNKRSSSETRIRLTGTVNDSPDFIDRNRKNEIIRPQTKIYTNIPQTNPIEICHANRIETESNNLSMVNIEPILTLNQYEVNTLNDQSYGGQIIKYTEQKPKREQSTLLITINEHMPTIQEDISVMENLEITYTLKPSINKANEISGDSGISLNTSHIIEKPIILNPLFKINNESLAEYKRTTISNQIPLASLYEEMTTTIRITDDDYYWKSYDNIHRPIIVYDTEWKDEKVQILVDEFPRNIQNAQYKYTENIEFEYVQINLPFSFEIQQNIDNDERVLSLSDDSYLIRHQQQTNICIDESLYLENPRHSKSILTLNYPHHKKRQSNLSTISSFIDMEIFLNQFEESLDHEQHLPLIDQISISYATSAIERNKPNYRSLPSEWFTPTILSYDEQLVEQWTVEKNLDTIQQEGTLNRQQVEFLTNNDFENFILANSFDAFCINEKFEELYNSTLRENNDIISHCSPTSDYETDTVEKDNDTATSNVIIPITILPSSSITNTTLLSQSSPLLTSHTAPVAPIVYFLDVLALEQKEKNNSTKDFLLTIGFGQNKMNEITNTVSTTEQPLRPTWIIRSSDDDIELLPTSIHQDDETTLSSIQQQIYFATENQVEDDNTALIIYPHYLQYDQDLGESVQAPLLSTVSESSRLQLPMVNEVHIYQMSLHTEFPFFYPPDALPHLLVSKIHDDELFSQDDYQINQPKILSFAQIHYLLNNEEEKEEETQPISVKLDQPMYIEHYYIQSLFPFPETCYAEINQPEIITNNNNNNNNNNFLSNFILTKPIKSEVKHISNNWLYARISIQTTKLDFI